MFQPQPTPFASSFHASSPHSHSYPRSHANLNPARPQHRSSQNVNVEGYDMGGGGPMASGGVGLGGRGGGGGGGGGGGIMGGAEMGDYSFPTPSDASCVGVGVGVGMALAPAGHGHSMANPLAHGAMGGLGLGMGMNMGLGLGSGTLQSQQQQHQQQHQQSQSRSQSLSLGGEAAGVGAGAGAGTGPVPPGAQAAPASAPVGGPGTPAATTAPAATQGRGAPLPGTGNSLYSSPSPVSVNHHHNHNHNHNHNHGRSHAAHTAAAGPASVPAAAAHFHHSPGASSATTSSSHSHSHSHHPGAPPTASSTFYNTNTSTAAPSNANSVSTRPSTMEPGDTSDLAAQEAAARDYQPQLEGPLVGDKITSDAIIDEYAKADEVYVAKTINLPQTYSHYRPIQGDGNCGWRAIGFSYFEHLVNNGDQNQILAELTRIKSLNQYLLTIGGYDQFLFEDMVDVTLSLMADLAQNIENPQMAMHMLLQCFNDPENSNAIIYHLRLLASASLKGHPELYEPFIPDIGIAGYCNEIERPNREIDQLGVMLLVQVLLKPANFVLEIAYLDRSQGSEVNIYRFPDEVAGQDPTNLGPTIYLLFRPDHYDILYKSAPNPTPLTLQVNRATSFSHRHEIASVTPSLHSFANMDYSPLAMLPGFGGPSTGISSTLASLASPTSTSPLPDAYDPSPQSPWLSTPYSDPLQQQPVPTPRPQPQAPPQPLQSAPASGKPSQPVDYQLRFSHQCFHLNNTSSAQPSMLPNQTSFPEPSFTTAMFRNSHFNRAHYSNPHFHPEEWTPDDDGHERVANAKKKGRLKSEH